MISRLKSVMAAAWQIESNEIPDDAALNAFKYWDSLGHITMLLAVESEFGLKLNEDSVQNLRSISDILSALELAEHS